MLRNDVKRTRRPRAGVSPALVPPLLTVAASVLLAQCDRPPPVEPAPPAETVAPPAPVLAQAALTRSDLLAAVARSASAHAAGTPVVDPDALVGRRFAIRLPLGCTGPAEVGDEGLGRWTWGPDRKAIRLSLTPADWADGLPIGDGAASGWEAVDGFWLSRPWLTTEACPAVSGDPAPETPVPPSPQTVGLAAVFEAEGSRLGRRNGRAYTFTLRADGETPLAPPARGYRVLMEGRFVAYPDGRAIRCRASGPDQRPVCIAAVQLDKVAFEDGATGATLSEWRPSA